jgi:CRISPR-associated protein Cas2
MFVVITYDVGEDRRRNRIFKTLKNHGQHVQYSVFECELRREDFRNLQTRLSRLIKPGEDNIRFYFLDRDAVARIEEIGKSHKPAQDRLAHFLIL